MEISLYNGEPNLVKYSTYTSQPLFEAIYKDPDHRRILELALKALQQEGINSLHVKIGYIDDYDCTARYLGKGTILINSRLELKDMQKHFLRCLAHAAKNKEITQFDEEFEEQLQDSINHQSRTERYPESLLEHYAQQRSKIVSETVAEVFSTVDEKQSTERYDPKDDREFYRQQCIQKIYDIDFPPLPTKKLTKGDNKGF